MAKSARGRFCIPAGIGKHGALTDLREGPTCGRAFRFIGESGDGYLVELEVAATAWALTASSGTTPSCCIRPRASQLT